MTKAKLPTRIEQLSPWARSFFETDEDEVGSPDTDSAIVETITIGDRHLKVHCLFDRETKKVNEIVAVSDPDTRRLLGVRSVNVEEVRRLVEEAIADLDQEVDLDEMPPSA